MRNLTKRSFRELRSGLTCRLSGRSRPAILRISCLAMALIASAGGAITLAGSTLSAQTPSPGAFDGTYAGSGRLLHQASSGRERAFCIPDTQIKMTIGNGQVTVLTPAPRDPGRNLILRGTVTPAGEVSASFTSPMRGVGFEITGAVRGGAFSGEIKKARCFYNAQMTRQ
jgi:hypothetical protein